MPLTREQILAAQKAPVQTNEIVDQFIDIAINLVNLWEGCGYQFNMFDGEYSYPNIRAYDTLIIIHFGEYNVSVDIYQDYAIYVGSNHYGEYEENEVCNSFMRKFDITDNMDYSQIVNAIIDMQNHYIKSHPDYE